MLDEIKIKRKIFKLLQKTVESGCTESEAMSAAEKAGELMDQYSLSITDVQIMESECVEKTYVMHNSGRGRIASMSVGVAKYCDVKLWIIRGRKSYYDKKIPKGVLHFFGLETDVDMALFLIDVIKGAMDRSVVEFKESDYWKEHVIGMPRGEGRRFTTGFRNGFASRISIRLRELKNHRNDELMRQQKNMEEVLGEGRLERTGRNIIAVKRTRVEEEFAKLNMKLTGSGYSTWGGNRGAKTQGEAAANNVHLGQGVSRSGSVKMIGHG